MRGKRSSISCFSTTKGGGFPATLRERSIRCCEHQAVHSDESSSVPSAVSAASFRGLLVCKDPESVGHEKAESLRSFAGNPASGGQKFPPRCLRPSGSRGRSAIPVTVALKALGLRQFLDCVDQDRRTGDLVFDAGMVSWMGRLCEQAQLSSLQAYYDRVGLHSERKTAHNPWWCRRTRTPGSSCFLLVCIVVPNSWQHEKDCGKSDKKEKDEKLKGGGRKRKRQTNGAADTLSTSPAQRSVNV